MASAVGGIPEIVVDGQTGFLVPFEAERRTPFGSPADPGGFAGDLASAVNALLADPDRAAAMGRAGRQRVLKRFTWEEIAAQTAALYREVLAV